MGLQKYAVATMVGTVVVLTRIQYFEATPFTVSVAKSPGIIKERFPEYIKFCVLSVMLDALSVPHTPDPLEYSNTRVCPLPRVANSRSKPENRVALPI